ncbi:PREDICTED: uncharacterized protein LOC106113698 [Papilio xuthus]|uniref:Uncharacterized protein LOC106113698 n=1 Tax=Papilio xuthus TaxID=66420 RepID=A0AAJ6YZF9_PAPXU|nr:PREDICTED: uncharacterized protein LOC106113698 [Papilio xuthus]
MSEKNTKKKLADIPLTRPGFDTLAMSAPTLVQMNPQGKWENKTPDENDAENKQLKAVIKYLIDSKAVSAAQSYCCQCAEQHQLQDGDKLSYVPVIMMPLTAAEDCPFDMDCEVQKMKETAPKKETRQKTQVKEVEKEKEKQKTKKRGYVLQRLTDFDLLSQW